MTFFNRYDVLFGVLAFGMVLFLIGIFMFAGKDIPSTLLLYGAIVSAPIALAAIRPRLAAMEICVRSIILFCFGFTFAGIIAFSGERDTGLMFAVGGGLFLVALDVLEPILLRKKGESNG